MPKPKAKMTPQHRRFEICEEYENVKKENLELKQSAFAAKHGIAGNTFSNWLSEWRQFKKDKNDISSLAADIADDFNESNQDVEESILDPDNEALVQTDWPPIEPIDLSESKKESKEDGRLLINELPRRERIITDLVMSGYIVWISQEERPDYKYIKNHFINFKKQD